MKNKLLLLICLLAAPGALFAQSGSFTQPNEILVVNPDRRATSTNTPMGGGVDWPLTEGDGYIVVKRDTVWGWVTTSKTEVTLEKVIDRKHNFICSYKLRDPNLKTIMMYNLDKKPLCLTRVEKNDKKMMRVVHEGKLNIYDGRIDYIYHPGDIDKNLIKIAYDNVVDDLSSFMGENTKRDLIGYVNDIYGLHIDPKTISWQQLLVKVDMLD